MPDVNQPSAGRVLVLAADLLARHPEADEVELVFTISAKSAVGPAGSRFAHRALTRETRHQTTVVPLPELFGRSLVAGPGPAGVLVPEQAFTIEELRSALAESDIVVVDEQ
jgi:hypothetical protein